MKNSDVAQAFARRRSQRSPHLTSDGTLLFSYDTCIAQWKDDNTIYLNITKYSPTTSHHVSLTRRYLNNYHIVEVEHVPKDTKILIR